MPHVKAASGQGRVELDNGFDAFESSFVNVDVTLPLAAAALAAGKIIQMDSAAPPALKSEPPLWLAPVKTALGRQEFIGAPPWANPPGNFVDVFTVSGGGVVRAIWFAVDMGPVSWDARLQVFVDGEASPSVDIDLGTLFLYHNNAGNKDGLGLTNTPRAPVGVNGTAVPANRPTPEGPALDLPHWHVERRGASWCSGIFRFPIPYSNGIKIRIMNPGNNTGANTMYWQVHNQPGASLPLRLKSLGRSMLGSNGLVPNVNTPACPGGKLAVPHDQAATLLDIAVSKPSWLAFYAMCAKATGASPSYTYLERNYQITIDNESSPSYVSTGTEDFFHSSWYWQLHNWTSNGVAAAFAANYSDSIANACIDLLALCDGLRFESRLKLDLLTEPNVGATDHEMSYVGLYYTST